jgi:glycine oxidase
VSSLGTTPDVLVVGAGVIGAAVAYEAAGRGHSVLLVDRGAPGGEASSAAAGVLAVGNGRAEDEPHLALRRASLARFPALAAALADETGIDVALDTAGLLELCRSEEEEATGAARAARRRAEGFRVERLSAVEVRGEELHVHPDVRAAFHWRDDARVDPVRLVDALVAGARRRGAEVWSGAAVTAVDRAGDRVARVAAGTAWVTPGTVVLAAGAWAAGVAGLAPDVGVEPARGQMLALRPASTLFRHTLAAADGYLVPCRNGEILVGATVERVGFTKAVTPAGVRELLARLAAIAPSALTAPIARMWAGLRPWAPGGPVVRRAARASNLVLACGHYRSGILLAPETAVAVADILG